MGQVFTSNKLKIINDPVFGFIRIPFAEIFDLMQDSRFQRLRRIRQGGLSHYVYPGANHTRFQHALGAMHLMGLAIDSIRSKGHEITEEEAKAVTTAILLHDIGHGPFSHSLENSIIEGLPHESISLMYMEQFNREQEGDLDMAIQIFQNEYPKRFLHQLVSSQLDMDRLDYLKRDSYFTGVTEGVIGSDRIIKMLNVVNDQLVVDEKGIYSIEKFLVARRLMYWQVYLHRTVISAEQVLVQMLRRARNLHREKGLIDAPDALKWFLSETPKLNSLSDQNRFLWYYSRLDDSDIFAAAKIWLDHDDKILAYLADALLNRNLFALEISETPPDPRRIDKLLLKIARHLGVSFDEAAYLVVSDSISNNAYSEHDEEITILDKQGRTLDIAEVSDILNTAVLSKTVRKYFLCYPKFIRES